MQTVEGYPTEIDVVEPTALVVTNGEAREVESLSISRELSSSLPSQVNAASGLTAATGGVSWAVGDDVQERSAHPWDGNSFPPKPTDEVVAFMGYGEPVVRQLTGVIDSVSGSVASGAVSSELVDPIDKLNRPVSFPALLNVMPPIEEGGGFIRVGLQSTYITDRILRECGFYATPAKSNGCVFSAPNMGSTWPEVGTVTSSQQEGEPELVPTHTTTPWGLGLSGGDVRYSPDFSGSGGGGLLDRTTQITLKAAPDAGTSGQSFVRAHWGSAYFSLTVWANRSVAVILHNGSTSTTVCSLSSAAASNADVFMLRIEASGACTLFASNGQSVSGSASLPSAMTGTHMSSARVYVSRGTGVIIGGAQVSFGFATVVSLPQTATLTPGASTQNLPAFPRIESRNALDILKEQAEAECASMWIDEHGHFRWVNRNVLTGAPVVATLTALDDVLDIGWESNASGVRSRVVLTSQDATIRRSRRSSQIAWQGRGASLDAGEVIEESVAPANDIDWIRVDEDLKLLPAPFAEFNRGRGSWAGGVATDDEGSQWATIGNPTFSVAIERVAHASYKITTNAGTPPSGRTIELRTPDEDSTTGIWRSRRNMDLPVLRAKAIVEWVERETTGTHPGPPNAAVLEHNVGPWVQNLTALQSLADWLSLQVFEPKPVLRDLSVIPDFRRQLGDVVFVEDEQHMRLRLKVLITKISTSVSAGSAAQSIGGRILEVQAYGVTNDQLDIHAGARTNAGFDTIWADATNAQLDNNPLERG